MFVITSFLNGQHLISADPFNIFKYEVNFLEMNYKSSLALRPYLNINNNSKWSIIVRNELFLSNNYPNLENMGNRWLGKGFGYFTSANISYLNNYFIISIEPYYYNNQNKYVINTNRDSPYPNAAPDLFNVLNDNRIFNNEPYKAYGFRESTLFIHYKKLGVGISNANMWWGPGVHSTLTMTNNTAGFPYILIGTISEKKYENFGINIRYVFSQLEKMSGKPYYSALVVLSKIYSNPEVSFGFSRNYLSGGLPTDRPFTAWDAAKLPFEWLFVDTKIEKYPSEWEAHDRWDQTLSGFLIFDFINSGLKIFLELGTDDHRQNWSDLRSQPEHNSASIFGLRKYGLANNDNLICGFEYANIKRSYTYKFREGGHWWWSSYYDYTTYQGRRWTAHSGSDSDDLYIYIGYHKNNLTLIPGINYERHGIVFAEYPEVKVEFRLDVRLKINEYSLNLFYEYELLNNLGFVNNNNNTNNVFWIGIEKNLNELISF